MQECMQHQGTREDTASRVRMPVLSGKSRIYGIYGECEVLRMKPTDDRKITDTLLRCSRGDHFADCEKGCAYSVRGMQCEFALMRDAAELIKHLRLTVDTLSEKVKTLQEENARLRDKLAKCEEDEE